MKKIKMNKDWIVAVLLLGTVIGGASVILFKFSVEINGLANSIAQGIIGSF